MSRHKKPSTANTAMSSAAGVSTISVPTPTASLSESVSLDPIIQRAMPHVLAGHYEKALHVLAAGGSSPPVQNARGVCLLRLGRYEDAVRLYRGLVLQAGGTWSRPDVPVLYKTNFATALLLDGHPSGCLSILEEVRDPSDPPVIRLRQALAKWQTTLSFLQRVNWWFGRIEPANCQVSIDFPPGDVVESQAVTTDEQAHPMNVYPPAVEQR